jgi:hypothetical protein
MSLFNDLVDSLFGNATAGSLLGGGAGYMLAEQGIEQARGLPEQLGAAAADISGRVGEAAQFKPYTVTTAAGSAGFTPEGYTQALAPEAQQAVTALQQQAAQQAGMIGQVTPEQLMQQMTALRQPEQARAQQELENRLAAQGRLGVSTAAYGGTPEQLALAKAQEEQRAADALSAITGARQLQMQDISNVSDMLTAAGVPISQATQAMQPSLTGLTLAQRPSELEAQALANLGQQELAGIPSAINAEALLRQAQLESITNALGLSQQAQATEAAGNVSNIADLLGGGVDWISGLFSGGGTGTIQGEGDGTSEFGVGISGDADLDAYIKSLMGGNQ